MKQIVSLLKVIADENRLKILCLLQKGNLCVCEIFEKLDLAQNLTSHHLGVLKKNNLVEDNKKGRRVHYSLTDKGRKITETLLKLAKDRRCLMKIQVLGPGCPNCQKVEENVKKAVKELGIKAEVEHVYDFNKMIEMGMMISPGLAIDGKLFSQGKIPDVEEIKKWLKQ